MNVRVGHALGFYISTHAPAGGATAAGSSLYALAAIFLLTPLREGRRVIVARLFFQVIFLLTPLREGRPCRS